MFPLDRPLYPFLSVHEARWMRSAAYKHCAVSLDKATPWQITYISRCCSGARYNTNEQEVFNGLRSLWNRTIMVKFSGLTFKEQLEIMSETNLLVTIHGAQLTNVIFMHPGGTVIEIFNPRFNADFYKQMSEMAEQHDIAFRNTSIVNEEPMSERRRWWHPDVNFKTHVNVSVLLSVAKPIVDACVSYECLLLSVTACEEVFSLGVHSDLSESSLVVVNGDVKEGD